ncbi:MAG: hypothetical protein ACRDHL_01725, partial [Candidatus Promineifilaceae bacterium]
MGLLFSLLSLLYAVRGLQVALAVGRYWAALGGRRLSAQGRHLAGQASFYLAVPVSVLLHELAHALAVWAFGGRVLTFGYRVFWGFVEHVGEYSPAERWFIALAGTLGSLAFGGLIWLLLRRHPAAAFRYFGLRAFHYQIYFSLVYYPLFTLLGFYGDWRTIYDFGATPLLSGATAVAHVAGLLLFWRANRRDWFETPQFDSVEAEARHVQAAAAAQAGRSDPEAQLALAMSQHAAGQPGQAAGTLAALL